ncbi:TIGR00282 family metallophosphoesterase [Clostridia bacterium]|nr:TIGR00282 family metallophosphoesterase [Clostridia bacterium]
MEVLFIGDIVGRVGRTAVRDYLARYKDKYDFIIANGENAAGGRGITKDTAAELFYSGIDAMTMGNHVWDKMEAKALIKVEGRIVRPANYPEGLPGKGLAFFPTRLGKEIAVVNLSGRAFLDSLDDPFRIGKQLLKKAQERTPYVFVDFHAEATSEKLAFKFYVDGMASLIAGTHTHVQTNDDEITESGMGYISDVGMTGPVDSILGMRKEECIERFLYGIPVRLQTATGRAWISGIHFSLDSKGRCTKIEKIREII